MKIIDELKYTKDHEWISVKESSRSGIIGITDFAQEELGDVVFVELPNIDDSYSRNDVFGTIEAVKTVADLYVPISGKIVEINEELESNPELINSDPYGKGWIAKIELEDLSDLDKLLNSKEYESLIK